MTHLDRIAGAPSAACENRKPDRAELQRRLFLEETQPVSEVVRRRIREKREKKGLSQAQLAEAMTAVLAPLSTDKISKIENGVRAVSIGELAAFAYVLEVPVVKLMSPLDGELPTRVGGMSLQRDEVANWLIWGPWWTEDAQGAQELMSLTLSIAFWMQAATENPRNPSHVREVQKLVIRLRDICDMPNVLRRLELVQMTSGSDSSATGPRPSRKSPRG